VLLLPLTQACCAPQTLIQGTNNATFCQIGKVIKFSRLHDTDETIEQVKEHNAVYAKLCSDIPANGQ
jgi:hypothetical protein